MTTQTVTPAADVRPDVRIEVHSHRHPKRLNLRAHGVQLRSPLWLLFLLLTFAVSVGGLFVVAWTLGAAAYTAPQAV